MCRNREALASLQRCAYSSEPSQVTYVISNKISLIQLVSGQVAQQSTLMLDYFIFTVSFDCVNGLVTSIEILG